MRASTKINRKESEGSMGLGEYVIEARQKTDTQIVKTIEHLRVRIEKLNNAPKPVSNAYLSNLKGKLVDYRMEATMRKIPGFHNK
jgi:ribosomal protein L29